MELFKKRPLAFFCFLFISAALFALDVPSWAKLTSGIAFVVIAVIFWAIFRRRAEVTAVAGFLCFVFVAAALLSSFAFGDLADKRAEKVHGNDRIVRAVVEEVYYSSDRSAEYIVKTTSVDGENFTERAVVTCYFAAGLQAGDGIAIKASVSENINIYIDARLSVIVYDDYNLAVLTQDNGSLRIFLNEVRNAVSVRLEGFLGENAGLAAGFFIGEVSDINPVVIRDFRRTGLTHILSVSGFHFSVLMSALELLLRKLRIPKKLRIVVMMATAVAFLALAGFAKPAVRSAIMLFAVYAAYIFMQDSDSVTSLFFAMAAIIFMDTRAVSDIGLWLSFLATLGILVIYPLLSAKIANIREHEDGKRFKAFCRRAMVYIFAASAVTASANIFVLIITAFKFGDFSLMSVPANLIISPLGSLFLILIPFVLILGGIPVFGQGICFIVSGLADLIVFFTAKMSGIPGIVVSLRFGFAKIIIVLMTAILAVLLVVKLKRKIMILVPVVIAVAAYCICLGSYNFINRNNVTLTYYYDSSNEALIMNEGYSAAICDISSGTSNFLYYTKEAAFDNYATEISELVLTHYHERQAATLDNTLRSVLVRRIYLPVPQTEEDALIANQIARTAHDLGVGVYSYEYDSGLFLLKNARITVFTPEYISRSVHPVICLAATGKNEALFYIGSAAEEMSIYNSLKIIAPKCDYIIYGTHGANKGSGFVWVNADTKIREVIFRDAGRIPNSTAHLAGISIRLLDYHPYTFKLK